MNLIISDLHLGSELCQVTQLEKFLEQVDGWGPERLILNGDILDSCECRLRRRHWRVLSALRRLSDHTEVVWVAGNHDGCAEPIAHLIGASFREEYIFGSLTTNGKSVSTLCVHGDRWDDFLRDRPFLTAVGDYIYHGLRWVDPSHSLAISAKHRSKTFLRCLAKVERGAREHAGREGCQVVVCGHTHTARAIYGSLTYVNTGSWTEQLCHYAKVADGHISLHQFEEHK